MTTSEIARVGRHMSLRGLRGALPGQRATVIPEHVLRDELARQVRGLVEVVLPYGRADVADGQFVIEVEPLRTWRHGVMQALAYSAQCDREPGLALFGAATASEVVDIFLRLRDGRPPIALWWHDGWQWQRISSRASCRRMQDWPVLDGGPIHFGGREAGR